MNTITLIAPIPQLTIPAKIKKTLLDGIMFKNGIIQEDRIFIKESLQNLIKINEKMKIFFEKHTGIYIEKGFSKSYTERKYFNITLYNKQARTKQQYHCYYADTGIYDITTVVSVMLDQFNTWSKYKD